MDRQFDIGLMLANLELSRERLHIRCILLLTTKMQKMPILIRILILNQVLNGNQFM